MPKTSFNTAIERYPFTKDGINNIKDSSTHGEDWPLVYILLGDKEAYVGETQSAYDRMNQRISNPKRKTLTKINLMLSDSFNKSAILNIENTLITHMHADGRFILQNGNGGQSKLHNYYQRSQYQNLFDDRNEMFEGIKQKNAEFKGLCRVLSGFSFDWRKKAKDKKSTLYNQDYDFEIGGYKYNLNVDSNASDFITNDDNLNKACCVYTSQGHDLNYAGVIFGKDVSYNVVTHKIEYNPNEFNDRNSKSNDINKTIKNIINAYLGLPTRGMYGTYMYAYDKKLRDHIKSLIVS